MKLLLVDDEPQARAKLRRFLADMPEVELVGEAGDGAEALALLLHTPADAVLLDIQMPRLDGLATAAALPEGTLVAFTTAYDEFAVKAFELNAVDYLLKPIIRERLQACIAKLQRQLAPPQREQQRQGLLSALHGLQPLARAAGDSGHWLVLHRGALQRVALAEVEVLEAEDNYVWLHTPAQSWLDRGTLAAMLEHPAAGPLFVRVHRSFAVNPRCIARIAPLARGDAQLVLASGREVRVSRRFREQLAAGIGR
ncbi:LytR/AlgR family response regulator transcription factor [Aquabacterium sp.]|uniref:LytR/AlgR family response regulator transcription factor n=1 Tax=Aquabacterium sp. TaxID=1872578 RepID=UPI00378448A7